MGFSNGGTIAVAAASHNPKIAAVVDYHGSNAAAADLRRLPPLLALHGEADATIPVVAGRDLVGYLKKISRPADLVTYCGVGHGFDDNPPAPRR